MEEAEKTVKSETPTASEPTVTPEPSAASEPTVTPEPTTAQEPTTASDVVTKKKFPLIPVIIGGGLALLAIFAALLIVLFAVAVPGIRHGVKVNAGEKYLTELDYDNAILSYEEAIRISPKKEDGYLGLAGVYRALAEDNTKKNDYASAIANIEKGIETLDTGYNKTKCENIKNELTDLTRKKVDLEKEFETLKGELAAFTNYYYILLQEKDAINYTKPYLEFNKNVSFLDLDGDDIQEMVYFRSENYYANYSGSKVLHYVTFKDGEVKHYLTKNRQYELEAGGGDHMVLFSLKDNPGLYASYDTGDEGWYTYILHFIPEEEGNLIHMNMMIFY